MVEAKSDTVLRPPNDKFYEKNGKDEGSLFAKSQFILVRHAEALHNVYYAQLKKDLAHLSREDYEKEEEKARFSRTLLDAPLTENGFSQCHD